MALLAIAVPAGAQSFPSPDTIASGLDFPAGIAFVGQDTILVTERSGAIRVIEDGELRDEPLTRIDTVVAGETGLLGIAVSPDGQDAFAFATEPDGNSNSVWRIPLGDPASRTRVVEGLPASTYHNGGGVAFAPDGMLLVSNGEQHSSDRAQDPGVLGGKVYRFTRAGDIPGDNPYGGSPTLAFGLRNPYGLAVDPETGSAWVTENGPDAFDEVNRIVPQGNYGWPRVEGPGDGSGLPGRYRDPVLAYEEIIVPTGLVFAGEDAREDVSGDLFFGTYGEGTIHRVELNDSRTEATSDEVVHRGDRVIGMGWGPRGLYFTTEDSVKVIDLVADTTPSPESSDGSPEATPGPSGVPEETTEDNGNQTGLLILVALALVAGGFYLVRRTMDGSRGPD